MGKIMTLEMPGIEPGAFHMQSERATTALHPHMKFKLSMGTDFSNQWYSIILVQSVD